MIRELLRRLFKPSAYAECAVCRKVSAKTEMYHYAGILYACKARELATPREYYDSCEYELYERTAMQP